MEANGTEREAVARAGVNNFALWFGMLAGPAAWLMHLQISFVLALWYCARQQSWPIHVITLVLLALTCAAGVVSLLHWRRSPKREEYLESRPDRPRFMAVLGLMSSALFFLVILAEWIPAFVIDPCQR
jgi:hypothetical protein